MKRIFAFMMIFTLLFSSISFAETSSEFSDLPESHWAYDAVMKMTERGILNGYGDGTFKPNEPITRGEFATIMVLSLGLEVNSSPKSTFIDLSDSHWVLPYVDAAKQYLTGYSSSDGIKFKPGEAAVREDMAIALVRAKGFEVTDDNSYYLNNYVDSSSISNGFSKYIATAIKNKIMIGSEKDGKKYFNPLDKLTRAEAAVLLLNVIQLDEEKIILSDEKIIPVPEIDINLKLNVVENKLKFNWTVNKESGLKGFKLVASKYDNTPIYPENGYIKYLSNNSYRNYELSGKMPVSNGDISYLVPGESYYFSVTGLYDDGKVASNTIYMKYPGSVEDVVEPLKPTVKLFGVVKDDNIILEWSDENDEDVTGFKVVASKSDTSPIYPENGYYRYLKKGSDQRVVINIGDSYNSGDIERFKAGEEYFFSITTLYGDKKVSSNVIKLKFNSDLLNDTSDIAPKVILSGYVDGELIRLNWTSYNDHNVDGYKVVASKYTNNPKYPENGYYRYITIGNDEKVTIELGASYKNGDFSYFEKGETYYFSITTLYDGKKINSNVIKLTF